MIRAMLERKPVGLLDIFRKERHTFSLVLVSFLGINTAQVNSADDTFGKGGNYIENNCDMKHAGGNMNC